MVGFPSLIMANDPDLIMRVTVHLESEYRLSTGRSPLSVLRALVSSPRLADYFVRGLEGLDLNQVADSFLSEHTMLCDWNQKSVGVGLSQWSQISKDFEVVQSFDRGDTSVFRVQVWPFDPKSLGFEAKKIAVLSASRNSN